MHKFSRSCKKKVAQPDVQAAGTASVGVFLIFAGVGAYLLGGVAGGVAAAKPESAAHCLGAAIFEMCTGCAVPPLCAGDE